MTLPESTNYPDDGVQQSEREDRSINKIKRRDVLKGMIALSAIPATSMGFSKNASADSEIEIIQSFESEAVGDTAPGNPWFLFNDGGRHEVVDSPESEGDQAFRTADASLSDPSAIAIDLDLSRFDKIKHDVYAFENNPSFGNIKVTLDEAGFPVPSNLRIWDFDLSIRSRDDSVPIGGGEDRWWKDFEIDISDRNQEYTVIFWVDGDNDAVWDNIRFFLSEIEATIDIKPCSDPNAINPNKKGNVPVAIKQTDDFDPTNRVDVDTLRFGAPDVVEDGDGARPVHDGHVEDTVPCDGDGKDDLVVHFPASDTGFDGDEDTGRLEGETKDGTALFGTDSVKLVGK